MTKSRRSTTWTTRKWARTEVGSSAGSGMGQDRDGDLACGLAEYRLIWNCMGEVPS